MDNIPLSPPLLFFHLLIRLVFRAYYVHSLLQCARSNSIVFKDHKNSVLIPILILSLCTYCWSQFFFLFLLRGLYALVKTVLRVSLVLAN